MINSWQVCPALKRTLRYPRFPSAHVERYGIPTQMNVTAARVTTLKFMLAVAIAVERSESSLMVIMLCVLGTYRYSAGAKSLNFSCDEIGFNWIPRTAGRDVS